MQSAPLIVLVHGLATDTLTDSIGRLGALFEEAGFSVAAPYRYGEQHVWGVRGSRAAVGNGLLSMLQVAADYSGRPVIPVGHSRGCLAIHDAAVAQSILARPVFTHAVYLSPAMDRDTEPAAGMERIDVHHTRSDWAVLWARFLPLHPFGDMGRRGYSGRSPVMQNFNATGRVAGHSGWWEQSGLEYCADVMIPQIAKKVGYRIPYLGFTPC